MALNSLRDLYIEQLKDLYSAENQIVEALPKVAKAASSAQLKTALNNHLEETKQHVTRLEQIFEKLGSSPKGKKCKGMEGVLAEGKEAIEEGGDPEVVDAALIAGAQRVEHYEMAGYGAVRTYAQLLGEKQAAQLLQKTLDEEGAADKKLTQIAEHGINAEAKSASAS